MMSIVPNSFVPIAHIRYTFDNTKSQNVGVITGLQKRASFHI